MASNRDRRMERAMDLFPQVYAALSIECKSKDVPMKDILTTFACQRGGGIYAEDNIARIMKNFNGQYDMYRIKYSDGSQQMIVRKNGPIPRNQYLSFEENPRLNRCGSLLACQVFKKHWQHVKKRINNFSSKY